MDERMAFFAVPDAAQTVLRRTFDGPIDQVFRAWTDDTILPAWWGPFDFLVSECRINLVDAGTYRIAMRHASGPLYVTTGTFIAIDAPHRVAMSVNLEEYPDDWRALFRPRGTPLETVPIVWHYDVTFVAHAAVTTVTLTTTYPVMADRDTYVGQHGERGWAESYEKLDRLLRA
jgi:uncharacterized protein YndB with AHSA1/START domain